MSEAKKIKIEWHTEGEFYTYRGKRLKDLKSLKNMRKRILSVKNAKWKWHIVLTFDDKSLMFWFKQYKDVGKALADYFSKIRRKFMGVKYFWKYEEGTKVWCKMCKRKVDFTYDYEREGWLFCNVCGNHFENAGERPHYHLLYDFINRGVRCKVDKINEKLEKIKKKKVKRTLLKDDIWLLEWKDKKPTVMDLKKLTYPKHWDKMDWNKWFRDKYRHEANRGKSKLEVLWGYYHYLKWGYRGGKKKGRKVKGARVEFNPNGRTSATEVLTYMSLKRYIIKDFFKFSESKWLKDTVRRKWTHTQNLIYDKKLEYETSIDTDGEWEQVLISEGYFNCKEAIMKVRGTKKNFIDYYDNKELKGEYIFERVIDDIMNMVDKEDISEVLKIIKQSKIDVARKTTVKCRNCGKEFYIDSGIAGMYCSERCFLNYSARITHKEKKPLWVKRRDGSYDFKGGNKNK